MKAVGNVVLKIILHNSSPCLRLLFECCVVAAALLSDLLPMIQKSTPCFLASLHLPFSSSEFDLTSGGSSKQEIPASGDKGLY